MGRIRAMSDDFKPGLEGVIAFESIIAEPDKLIIVMNP